MSLTLLSLLLASTVVVWYRIREYRKAPLPPGPGPSIPVLGNLRHIPRKSPWLGFTEMKAEYGPVTMFHGLGNHILVLNTAEAISDVVEKNYAIYSDRPQMTLLSDLAGLGRHLPFINYGSQWRDQRKVAHLALCASAVTEYRPLIEEATLRACKDIARTPKDFFAHIKLIMGRVILSSVYGIEIDSPTINEFISYSERTLAFATANSGPGKNLCDLVPSMKYLPSWLPFHRLGKHGRNLFETIVYGGINYVKGRMAAGTALPSITRRMLEEYQGDERWEFATAFSTGAMYGAGSGTTHSTILTFILLMALNPKVQAKARTEIDSKIEPNRYPSLSEDFDTLPYLSAVLKETMRWHPTAPLALPRSAREEGIYNGYRIPKGTTIIPNVWAISREPNPKYPPEEFIPERFLDLDVPTVDPATWAFGFGRRMSWKVVRRAGHIHNCLLSFNIL